MSEGKPKLQHLAVQHGKTGHGLGIDFDVPQGPVTLLNLSQFDAGETFKLIYSIAEVVPGDILNIGNPNCRVKVQKPIPQFFEEWCQQAPPHHIALGLGDFAEEIEAFAESMGLTFTLLHDPSGRVQQTFQTTGVPESFVVDRNGVIFKKIAGATVWDAPQNVELIQRLLGG